MSKENTIAQGAEAVLIQESPFKLIKHRIKKSYRLPALDQKLRRSRTKKETRLLQKASKIIPTPTVFSTDDKEKIEMQFLPGKKLSEHLDSLPNAIAVCQQIGKQIARLHDSEIIHGDLTTSNMILSDSNSKEHNNKNIDDAPSYSDRDSNDNNSPFKKIGHRGSKFVSNFNKTVHFSAHVLFRKKNLSNLNKTQPPQSVSNLKNKDDSITLSNNTKPNYTEQDLHTNDDSSSGSLPKLFFIDYGLGFSSNKVEHKATDLHLIKQALEAKHYKNYKKFFQAVIEGYKTSLNAPQVLKRLEKVELRGRYKQQF